MSTKLYKVRTQMSSRNYEIRWEIPNFLNVCEVADIYENNKKHMSEFKIVFDAGSSPGRLPVRWSFELAKPNKGDGNFIQVIVKREFQNVVEQQKAEDEVCIRLQISVLKDEEFTPIVPQTKFGMKPRATKVLNLLSTNGFKPHLSSNGKLTLQIKLEQFEAARLQVLPEVESLKSEGASKCLEDFSALLSSGNLSDFLIKFEDGTIFKVHKAILASRSSVLDRMLQSGMEECAKGEVTINDMSPQTMKLVLQFLYSGKLDEKSFCVDNVEEIVYAADKYDLPILKEAVNRILPILCVADNAINLLKTSKLYGLKAAEEQISVYVEQNIREILRIDSNSDDNQEA